MTENVTFAVRHARLRWLGAPLLITGVGLLFYALYSTFVGGSGLTAAMAAFGTGLALATFGANHDTAMAYCFSAREQSLPRALKDELAEELDRDREGLVSTRPSPKIGLVMPFVAISVQLWVAARLFGFAL
jgi:hypothetical protein